MADAAYAEGLKQLSGGTELVAWGTVAATLTGWPGLVQDFKGPLKQSIVVNQGFGLAGGANNISVVATDVSGTIETNPQNPALFKFLGLMTDTGSNPYTHTLTQSATPPSFSLVETSIDPLGGSNHVTRQYVGCKMTSLQIAYPQKDKIKCTWGWAGKTVSFTTTKQTLTPATANPYLTTQTALSIGGVEDTNVYNATVNIDMGMAVDNHVFNSLLTSEQAKGVYGTTITFDRNFVNSAVGAAALAGTPVNITLVTTRGANDTMTVTLTNCVYTDHDKSSGYKEKQRESVTLTATSFSIAIVDATSTYAF